MDLLSTIKRRDPLASKKQKIRADGTSGYNKKTVFDEEGLAVDDNVTLVDAGSIDLGELNTWQFSPGAELRQLLGSAAPDARIPLGWWGDLMEVVPVDLDGDGRQDFLIVGEESGDDGEFFVVQLVVRR